MRWRKNRNEFLWNVENSNSENPQQTMSGTKFHQKLITPNPSIYLHCMCTWWKTHEALKDFWIIAVNKTYLIGGCGCEIIRLHTLYIMYIIYHLDVSLLLSSISCDSTDFSFHHNHSLTGVMDWSLCGWCVIEYKIM